MSNGSDQQYEMKTPVMVPFKWIVVVLSLAGSAMVGTFSLATFHASNSNRLEAQAASLTALEAWRLGKDKDDVKMQLQIQRIENILEFQFPQAAKRARAQ